MLVLSEFLGSDTATDERFGKRHTYVLQRRDQTNPAFENRPSKMISKRFLSAAGARGRERRAAAPGLPGADLPEGLLG